MSFVTPTTHVDVVKEFHEVKASLARIEHTLSRLQESVKQLQTRYEIIQLQELRRPPASPMRIVSPRLVDPGLLADFELEVREDTPDA